MYLYRSYYPNDFIILNITQYQGTFFNKYVLTLIPACKSNHMLSQVWDEITYPFLNLNSATVEV